MNMIVPVTRDDFHLIMEETKCLLFFTKEPRKLQKKDCIYFCEGRKIKGMASVIRKLYPSIPIRDVSAVKCLVGKIWDRGRKKTGSESDENPSEVL